MEFFNTCHTAISATISVCLPEEELTWKKQQNIVRIFKCNKKLFSTINI